MSQNEDSKVDTGKAVLAEVADALKTSSQKVRGRLVDALVERELAKRVDLLDKALVTRAKLNAEVNKIRPKKMYDASGQEVPGFFTAEEVKTLNQAKEKLAKFDRTLEAAFNGEGFDKLAQAVGGGGSSEE